MNSKLDLKLQYYMSPYNRKFIPQDYIDFETDEEVLLTRKSGENTGREWKKVAKFVLGQCQDKGIFIYFEISNSFLNKFKVTNFGSKTG